MNLFNRDCALKCRLDAVPFPCIARQAERGVVAVIWWSLPKIDKGHWQCNGKMPRVRIFRINQPFHAVKSKHVPMNLPNFPLLGGCHLQIQHHSLHPLGPPCWRDSKWSSIALPAMTWQLGSNRRMEISGKKLVVSEHCKDTLLTIDAQGRLLVWLGGINCKVKMQCQKHRGPCINLQLEILSVSCCRGSPPIVFAALFGRPVALPQRLVRYPWAWCVVLADRAPTYIILHSYLPTSYISHVWNFVMRDLLCSKGQFALIHVWASTLW